MKIFFVLIIAGLLSGCNPNIREAPKDEIPWSNIIHFEYKEHLYILFAHGTSTGVVHDPDCPCSKKVQPGHE